MSKELQWATVLAMAGFWSIEYLPEDVVFWATPVLIMVWIIRLMKS